MSFKLWWWGGMGVELCGGASESSSSESSSAVKFRNATDFTLCGYGWEGVGGVW